MFTGIYRLKSFTRLSTVLSKRCLSLLTPVTLIQPALCCYCILTQHSLALCKHFILSQLSVEIFTPFLDNLFSIRMIMSNMLYL